MSKPKNIDKEHPSYEKELRHQIAYAISRLGTHSKASDELGVSTMQISRWINGKSAPSFINMIKLSVTSGVSLNFLAYGKDSENNDANKAIDTEALTDVIEIVDEATRETRISSKKKSELIALCYDYYISSEDEEKVIKHIAQIIKLAS